MVVASQAAHWFDYSKVWPMLARKLRKGGTMAFLGFRDNIFVDHPRVTELLNNYCYDPEVNSMGPYWEQPGRDILRGLYRSIVPPETDFIEVTRWEYEPGLGEGMMYKTVMLGEMEGYARTFSSYYRLLEGHPDQRPKEEGGTDDVVDEMFEKILEAEPEWKKSGDSWRDIEVESVWKSVVLLARNS
jgi:hypothetical protein